MANFQSEWAHFYGSTPPLAFMLRAVAGKPWVRFHALPGSVRYASTEFEYEEIRRRAIILGTETLGQNSDCWLVQCQIEQFSKPYWKTLPTPSDIDLRYRDEDDDFDWVASASYVLWHEDLFSALLKDIADDRTGPTLWFNRASGTIFAPYDGGFDLFLISLADVNRLRARYSDWLSLEPSGL